MNLKIQNRAVYTPLTYEEILRPIETAQKSFEEAKNELDTTSQQIDKLDDLKFSDVDKDSSSVKILDKWHNVLEDNMNDLISNGTTPTNRRNFYKVKVDYDKEISPILEAASRRQNAINTQNKEKTDRNSLMIYEHDADKESIDQWLDPTHQSRAWSGAEILKQTANMANVLSTIQRPEDMKTQHVLGYNYAVTIPAGLKFEDIENAVNSNPNLTDPPNKQLAYVINTVRDSLNIPILDDPSKNAMINGYIREGLMAAIGKPSMQILSDTKQEQLDRFRQNQALQQQRFKNDLYLKQLDSPRISSGYGSTSMNNNNANLYPQRQTHNIENDKNFSQLDEDHGQTVIAGAKGNYPLFINGDNLPTWKTYTKVLSDRGYKIKTDQINVLKDIYESTKRNIQSTREKLGGLSQYTDKQIIESDNFEVNNWMSTYNAESVPDWLKSLPVKKAKRYNTSEGIVTASKSKQFSSVITDKTNGKDHPDISLSLVNDPVDGIKKVEINIVGDESSYIASIDDIKNPDVRSMISKIANLEDNMQRSIFDNDMKSYQSYLNDYIRTDDDYYTLEKKYLDRKNFDIKK